MPESNPYEPPTTLKTSAQIEPPRGSVVSGTFLQAACWLQIGCLIGLFYIGLYEVGTEGLSFLGWIGLQSFLVIDFSIAIFIIIFSFIRRQWDWLLVEAVVIGIHLACWLWASLT